MSAPSRDDASARLQLALDLVRTALLEIDLRTTMVTMTGHVRDVLGIEPGGRPTPLATFLERVHPDDVAIVHERLASIAASDAPVPTELRIVFPDGAVHWVDWRGARIVDADGEVVKIVAAGRDVTARRERTARLAESAALLRAVLDNLPISVYTKDCAGRYVLNNATNLRLLGAESEDAVRGRTAHDFFPEGDAAAFAADDRAVIETGRAIVNREEPFVDPRTGRSRWFLTTKVPLDDADGNRMGLVGLSRDITDAKLHEQQLLQSQKIEMLGRLAGGIAHDFNNLLTVILGSVELLRLDGVESEPVENIQLAATQAAHLTRQLLTFARQQVVVPRVLDLNLLLQEAERMLRRLIAESIDLQTATGDDLWRVSVDPGQMMQVLVNLVVNARDAMPGGGRLRIATANVTLEAAQLLDQPEVSAGEYVRLSVTDTGVGLTDEVKAHLFEAFYTTKEKGRGTGLGLATSFGIVRQAAGFIRAEGAPGAGATFSVYLPRAEDAPERPAAPARPGLPVGRR